MLKIVEHGVSLVFMIDDACVYSTTHSPALHV